jgi:epoxide hydrolase-like predicted phosphatase
MEKIKAILFDWGGVLIEDPGPELMGYCAEVLGVSVEDYTRAHNKFQADYQKGLLSEDEFWRRVCGELNIAVGDYHLLWAEAFEAVYKPKGEIFSMAKRLRARGYLTGVLSDTEPAGMEYFYRQGYDMFDVVVFSCAEGVKKPERQIYELALERLGVAAGEAVFIDNRADFIEGARVAGLKTILFESVEQVRNELKRLGVGTD